MRADKFFAEKYGSRTKAANALDRGCVLRNGKALKPSDEVKSDDSFQFVEMPESFVSNGGFKLSRALDFFQIDVANQVFADLGASTGGFTDCLLQRNAKSVYCVDVGESLLDSTISSDSRVTVMDRTNARYLTAASFPEQIDGVVSDLSFISLTLILPAVSQILSQEGYALLLIKPQFEVGKKKIGKSGIVARKEHTGVIDAIYDCAVANGLSPLGIVNAPIREKKNIEYVTLLSKGQAAIDKNHYLAMANSLYEERSE